MKILYVASKYDYGKRDRGLSFEHYNFFNTLFNTGNEIIYFDYTGIMKKIGRARMNQILLEVVHAERPELIFVFLLEYELDPKVIIQISNLPGAITVNWFADDQWRFDNYSRYWAPCFNWVVTTDPEAVSKYHSIGVRKVVLSQWACNHFLYRNAKHEKTIDVSFIGQAYGNRRAIIKAVETDGINVTTKGGGWKSGRATLEEMIAIINHSRISLNLANASVKYTNGWLRPIDRYALYNPLIKRLWRMLRSRLILNFTNSQPISQIKGRNFEVPGCGGFLLTDYVIGLENFYTPEREIACYRSVSDLKDKIRYYLEHDEIREQIAFNGYKTTVERHTYVHRFNDLFGKMGLKCDYSLDAHTGGLIEVGV